MAADGERLTVGAGHAWIDGLLCELATDTDVDRQPDLPSSRLPTDEGTHLVYLQVWQREITATEDETLREPALGGPDTTVRLSTVAQVCLERVSDDDHGRPSDWSIPAATTDATLAVPSRYEGAENALYRVEIHDPGAEPTFKWARDNGSTTAMLEAWTPTELVLRREQPRIAVGDHLEVVDRVTILKRGPGMFVRVERVDGSRLAVSAASAPVHDHLLEPLVRRWESTPTTLRPGQSPSIELEAGLELAFRGSDFRTGDYWVFAARIADGSVTWPDATAAASPHAPHGVEVHHCPLAAVSHGETGWKVLRDLRTTLGR